MKTFNDVRSASFIAYLLVIMFRDPEFFRSYRYLIQPAFFSDGGDRLFVRCLLDHWDAYGVLPDPNLWKDYTHDWIKANPRAEGLDTFADPLAAWRVLMGYGKVLTRAPFKGCRAHPWLRERVIQFAKEHKAMIVIGRIVDRHRRERLLDPSEAVDLFKEVVDLGADAQDLGTEFWTDYESVHENLPEVVPTSIEGVDEMHGGGLARTELFGLVAPPKTFKTGFMLNIACNVSQLGYTVYYASGEESAERLKMKVIAKLTGVPPAMQDSSLPLIKKVIERCKKFMVGKLYIKRFKKRDFTAKNIDAWINMVGEKPDVIISDYADLMSPNRREEKMADFLVRGIIPEEFRELGIIHNAATVSANKAKVDVNNKAFFDAEGIGLSGEKGFVYDSLNSISMTPEMRLCGELIFHNIYNRYGPGKETIGCRVNLPCTQLLYSQELTDKFQKQLEDESGQEQSANYRRRGRMTTKELQQFGSDDIKELILASRDADGGQDTQAHGRVIQPVKRKKLFTV